MLIDLLAALAQVESSGAPVLALRGLVAAAAFALLFVALKREDDSSAPADFLRRAGFALLGGVTLFLLTESWQPREARGSEGVAFQARMQGEYLLRLNYVELPRDSAGPDLREQAIKELREGVREYPQARRLRLMLGIAEADAGRFPAALKTIESVPPPERQKARIVPPVERRPVDEELWRTLYGREVPTEADLKAAAPRIKELKLGWFGDLALFAAAKRMPGQPGDVWEAPVREGAAEFFARFLPLGLGLFLILPQISLVVFVVGLILIRSGVLRPVEPDTSPVSHILWESLVLYLALAVLPGRWMYSGGPAPQGEAALVMRLLISDAVQLLAILYLVLRLRLAGFGADAVGLTGRSFWINLGLGVALFSLVTPLAWMTGIATQWVSDQFFPNLAPPYHPIAGATVGASSTMMRLALFTVVAIGAPLLEEIFFRGCMYGALRRRWGRTGAIVASSAFFAILHPQLPLGFIPIAVLGALFCVIYEWRQSLVPGMIVHGLNNGVIFLLLFSMFPRGG